MQSNSTTKTLFAPTTFFTFLIPSLIGLLLFATPVRYQDNLSIPVAALASAMQSLLDNYLPAIVTCIVLITGSLTLLVKFTQPGLIRKNTFFYNLFNTTHPWCAARLLGAAFIISSYFQIGPQAIWSESTGGMVLYDLLPVLFCVFIFAGLLLPFLMSFGLLELIGTFLTRIMRPLFGLPGRSAVNCITSWLGDGSVGILMTCKQYESRHYTQKEAAIIGTTFSSVSITFSLIVLSQVKLQHLFVPFFLTVCLAGIVAAIIVPRLPPLSRKKNHLINGQSPAREEDIPEGHNSLSWGLHRALEKAANINIIQHVIQDGLKNAIDMVFGVLPVVMCIGTIGLIVAEYTPVFDYLGMPFVPLLELLHIPEATKASTTMVVGFADMFVPSILAASIESELTRFVIAALSLTQLIYLSEVGALLLGSKIPVTLWELFVIFILRTLVTLPVIAAIAHLIF
ncbi:hypothetical protein CI610_00695 [invertebrate metagenome]|uniref:Nucleoside transporter/FeoB GTPase Gate domain-containing protein n=1 Tax=invertebrate metagenome TaxID=1711999 RepID=A0A2H9TAP1_9ZZZZ